MSYRKAEARLPLSAIEIRYVDQYEKALDYVTEHPHDYEDALENEPVDVELARGVYWLEDGHHRFVTAELRGDSEINAMVSKFSHNCGYSAAVTSEDEIIYETLGRGIHNDEYREKMRKHLEDVGVPKEKIKEVLGGSSTRTYYHASPHELDYFLDFTALAFDPEDALGYLRDKPGYLHEVTVKPRLKIADEEDIKQAASALDDPLLEQEDFVFTLADHYAVRDALEAQGFEAMQYEDVGPDNLYEHDTLVVFDGDDIDLVDVTPVNEGSKTACISFLDRLHYQANRSLADRSGIGFDFGTLRRTASGTPRRLEPKHRPHYAEGRRRRLFRRSRRASQRSERSSLPHRRDIRKVGTVEARKVLGVAKAVSHIRDLVQAKNQGSVTASLNRDRDAGAAEIELERLFRALLPDTKFEGKVFAVGGYVRDQLQHREPADLDMVVEMPYGAQRFVGFLLDEFPTQLSDPEPLTYDVPIWNMHFTDDVMYAGETYGVRGAEIDVTDTQTLEQLDGEPLTSYGPISEDVLRRDYTVNMIYKDLTSGKILDPTGVGQSDIERGLLRARPDEDIVQAFHDQPKRMLRLVRFMAQYGWTPDPAVEAAIHEAVDALAEVSGRSLQKEFKKLKKRGILDKTLHFMKEYGMVGPLKRAWRNREKE